MKILVISAQPPSPYSGGEIRLLNLIKNLAHNHEFTVLTPLRQSQKNILEVANQICRVIPTWLPETSQPRGRLYYQINAWRQAFFNRQPNQVNNFYSPLIQQAVDRELRSQAYDLIQVQQLYMVQYLCDYVHRPAILDIDNLWSKLFLRQAKNPANNPQVVRFNQRIQTRLDQKKIPAYEKRELQRFDGLLVVSADEEQTVHNLAPLAKIAVVPNGVDCDYFKPQQETLDNIAGVNPINQPASQIILFTGTMAYEPNAEAVEFFSNDILPGILDEIPSAVFQIVGRDPTPKVRALAQSPSIQVTDFVEDVRPYMAASAIFVVPIRSGAGTRIKILEALAMKKAVITTSIGVEGLDLRHGEHLLIADDPVDFTNQALRLLRQPGFAQRLGENGRRQVASKYDWKQISVQLGVLYEDLGSR